MCTDGLSDLVWSDEIAETLRSADTLKHAGQTLIDIANQRGGHDNITVVLLSVPLFALMTAGEANLIPSDKVVKGDELMAYDIQYMHRKGIFPAEEEPLYFYSDALFMIRDDGNGFTDHYVFSYWKDEGRLNVEKEQFGNISKIDVKYSDGTGENTIVNIVRNDGSNFVLYVSSVDGLDKVFVRQLQRRWDTVKAAKEGLTHGES